MNSECVVCGTTKPNLMTINRIDPLGLHRDNNCESVCYVCNCLISDHGSESSRTIWRKCPSLWIEIRKRSALTYSDAGSKIMVLNHHDFVRLLQNSCKTNAHQNYAESSVCWDVVDVRMFFLGLMTCMTNESTLCRVTKRPCSSTFMLSVLWPMFWMSWILFCRCDLLL